MAGLWRQQKSVSGAKQSSATLELRQDGSFALVNDALTLRGQYDAADGRLRVAIDGKTETLGSVQPVGQDTLVLRVGDRDVILVRDPAATTKR